jgi:hypothetical protein
MATKTLTMDIAAHEVAKYAAAIDGYMGKIDRSLERNKRAQVQIVRLKAETREILARLKAQMR